jgi:DNA-directed RNA polymerase subunit RPC12/RpoP
VTDGYPVQCPTCGAQLLFDARPTRGLCTVCGGEFELPPDDSQAAPEGDLATARPPESDDDLDGLRIRQLTQLRRSLYRSRSYMIVVLCGGIVAILQSVILIARQALAEPPDRRTIVYGVVILIAGFGIFWSRRKLSEIRREIETLQRDAPATNPDFTTLSDGSQRARNLENLHD